MSLPLPLVSPHTICRLPVISSCLICKPSKIEIHRKPYKYYTLIYSAIPWTNHMVPFMTYCIVTSLTPLTHHFSHVLWTWKWQPVGQSGYQHTTVEPGGMYYQATVCTNTKGGLHTTVKLSSGPRTKSRIKEGRQFSVR